MPCKTPKIFSEYYTKPQDLSQQPSVGTLLTFRTGVFLKKIAQFDYGRGYELDDRRVRIPVKGKFPVPSKTSGIDVGSTQRVG